MRPFVYFALSALFSGAFLAPADAQVGAGNYNLSDYSIDSVHGEWTVLCTAPGTGSRDDDLRDCAVEDSLGYVMFVYPSGYYAETIRDYGPGDQLGGRDLTESPGGVILTYISPAFAADDIGRHALRQNGEERHLSPNGFAEAEARALELMGAAP